MALAFTGSQSGKSEENAQRQATLRRLEGDLISLESDRSKLAKNVDAINLELRDMQKKWNQLGLDIKDKQKFVKKDEERLRFFEEEIRVLKKKMNNV